mmetsp:Transcript_49233/g.157475  ORF Transcript_49233/g.157475 Transcript_49233/m.157475 type:complete len:495 (-) Transcript_49233:222-1706(-)
MAEALAAETLGFCKEVTEAAEPAKKTREDAEKLLAEGKHEEALRKATEALAGVAALFTKAKYKSMREKALRTVNKTIAHFQQAGDQLGEAHATRASARIQVTKNRPEGSKKAAMHAASLFRMKGDKKGEASAMVTVVDSHLSKAALVGAPGHVRQNANLKKTPTQVEEENKQQALKHQEDAMNAAREVVELFRQANDKRGQADMLCALADINNSMEEFERAKEVSMMARDLYLDLDDRKGAQKALELEHEAHIKSGDGEEALNAAQEMVKMYRQGNDKNGEAEGMFLVMKTHFQMGSVEELMKVGQDARNLCQRANDVEMEGIIIDSMTKAQMHLENDEEALKLAKEAVDVFKKGGHKKGQADAMHACAGIILDKFFKESEENMTTYRKSGYNVAFFKDFDLASYDKALAMVHQAEELYKEIKDKEGLDSIVETQQHITIKATMLNEPDETKQIVKDARLIEVVHKWNIPDPEDEAKQLSSSTALEIADTGDGE